MKSITSKAQKLALSIKLSIKDHSLNDALLLKEIHDDKDIYDDELENYYYLTYKDYDKLRIIIVNIFNLIFHDLKNKKRKHMEKIINLMYIFNNTYIYIILLTLKIFTFINFKGLLIISCLFIIKIMFIKHLLNLSKKYQ